MTNTWTMPDLLFIHIPKLNDSLDEIGETTFINLVPSGVFALADFLNRSGFYSRILHLGIESILNKNFDLCKFIETENPMAIALSLHWHYQSYHVIETARQIKRKFPCIPIILGGLTAGFFAPEILEQYDCIDFIIEGDSEIPLKMLMEHIKANKIEPGNQPSPDFVPTPQFIVVENENHQLSHLTPQPALLNNIPNLFYKLKNLKESIADDTFLDQTLPIEEPKTISKKITRTPKNYSATPQILNSLHYYNFELLYNYQFYRDEMGIPSIWLKNKTIEQNRKLIDRLTKVYFPMVGKGCPLNCTWCGKEKREKTLFRDIDVVVNSIKEAENRGFRNLYFTFHPCNEADDFYLRLFQKIRKECLNMSAYFECWHLPSRELIVEFGKTFKDGIMALSPESGSEEVRKLNRGVFYTNKQLKETLDFMQKTGVEADLFFSVGIPGENEKFFEETKSMIKHFREKYKNIQEICLFAIELEPGSPWFENPGKFGIISERKTFEDYYNAHKPGNKGSYNSLGYYIPGFFTDPSKCSDVDSYEKSIKQLRNTVVKLEGILGGQE